MMNRGNQLGHSTSRRLHWLTLFAVLVGVVGFGFATLGTPGTVSAYQADDADKEGEAVPKDDKDGGDKKEDAETPEEARGDRNFLEWLIHASGMFGFILLLLSFVMVALIMMNILQVRRDNLLPPDFIDAFEQRLAAKDYQGAYETAKNDDSFVGRVLAAGLSKLNRGYEEAIEGMQEVGEDENMSLDHRLSYLALIGTVAPMIGLMGTVYGMILSFEKIANSKVSPKPAELADGISTALFTTLEGLSVAIPALVFYSILRNRVSRFVLEVGMVSEGLMSRFSTVGKKPGSGGTSSATATAPATPTE